MIYFGKNVKQSHLEPLRNISMDELVNWIRTDQALFTEVEKLRKVKTLNPQAYREMKTNLPFFIGARFEDGMRLAANLQEVTSFVIDFDHLSYHGINPDTLKEKLKNDHLVWLSFISPGGDGLKVVIKLSQTFSSSREFQKFYLAFLKSFARHYEVEELVDYRTHDVTRICFLSHDPDLYYNPKASGASEIDFMDFFEDENTIINSPLPAEFYEEYANDKSQNGDAEEESIPLDQEILDLLKNHQSKNKNYQKSQQIYVPEALKPVPELTKEKFKDLPISLSEVKPIQYGLQLTFDYKAHFAEFNIYYGKNGFRLVANLRRGHNPQLTEHLTPLLHELLHDDIPAMNNLTSGLFNDHGEFPF